MSDSEATPARTSDKTPDEPDQDPSNQPEATSTNSPSADETPPASPVEPQDADYASVVVVGRNEDVAAVCGRIDTAPTYAVVVHAPGGNRELSREIGIRRLKKHAEDSGRTIAIATSSWSLASRARTVRIPVARKPEHVRWDSGGRQVLRFGRGSLLLPPLGRYVQGLAVVAAILVVVGLVFTMAPAATVTAYPPTETVEETVSIIASPNFSDIDLETFSVPAQNVSSSRTVTLAVPATGTANVGENPAQVTIGVYNDTDADVTLPAGTVFVTSGDAPNFELLEEAAVSANGQLWVSGWAMEPGTAGNIGPGTVTGLAEPIEGIRVENQGNAGGGTDVATRAVSGDDVAAIRDLAENLAVVESIKQTLVEDRPHDAIFLDTASVDLVLGNPSPPPGTPSELLVMEVRVTVSALAVVSSVLDELALAVLAEGQEGEFIPGSVTASETGARQFDTETRTMETEVLLRGEFARGLSSDDIESAVSWKSEEDAAATLDERYGIDDAEVDVSPGWAPRLPWFGFRIDVELRTRDGAFEDEELSDTATLQADPSTAAGN